MAKLKHQKRQRPRPLATRRRRVQLSRGEERRTREQIERWRRA